MPSQTIFDSWFVGHNFERSWKSLKVYQKYDVLYLHQENVTSPEESISVAKKKGATKRRWVFHSCCLDHDFHGFLMEKSPGPWGLKFSWSDFVSVQKVSRKTRA